MNAWRVQVLQNLWLSIWSNATTAAMDAHEHLRTNYYLSIYVVFGFFVVALTVGRSFW